MANGASYATTERNLDPRWSSTSRCSGVIQVSGRQELRFDTQHLWVVERCRRRRARKSGAGDLHCPLT
jgi:hypothetical protein